MINDITYAAELCLIKRLIQACFMEKLFFCTIESTRLLLYFNKIDKKILVENVVFFCLNKLKITGNVYLLEESNKRILKLSEFLNLMYVELQEQIFPDKWERFLLEINNCLENDILVKQHAKNIYKILADLIATTSMVEYISNQYAPAEQLIFFESWARQGHPYHPCHKTKLGFSAQEYQYYSPEFNADINILLAAIDKDLMRLESEFNDFNYCNWFAREYAPQWQGFCKSLCEQGYDPAHYYPIFIHAWQYQHIIKNRFQTLIDNKQLFIINNVSLLAKASLSFRTLMTVDPTQAHIKLPVAVHSTSALRVISPTSVVNSPKLSKVLKGISQSAHAFTQYIKFAGDNIALQIKDEDSEVAKHLAIIYRENPLSLLEDAQLPIVVAALYENSAVSNLALFIELIHKAVGTTVIAAIAYFDNYVKIVIRGYLDLFLLYGIALEGHQQNTIAVFENYLPVYMIARDLGGLRIDMPTLQSQGFNFVPYPNSPIIVNDSMHATNKFIHAVMQHHIGEIILLLIEHYDIAESRCWKIVKNHIEAAFAELKDKMSHERWQQEYQAILVNDWQVKGLLRMRLEGIQNQYIFINLKNPLKDL